MKLINRKALIAISAILAAAVLVVWLMSRLGEPSWEGRRLSEWLDVRESHHHFIGDDGQQSPSIDDEIEQALNAMRPEALPVMLEWLTMKPSRLKARLNKLLEAQPLIPFRFDDRNFHILACTGFMAYGTDAQPVLPKLLRLSHSPDPETRMLAYEAAFFTRPDKEIFLPLAARALREKDAGVQAMAAQWMTERFPAEAEKAGLRE